MTRQNNNQSLSGKTENKDSEIECNFLAIVDVELKNEMLAEFKKWFSEVNRDVLSQFDGFVSRTLIESLDGKHRIILMTRDKESLLKIRSSPRHMEIHNKALTFMTRPPVISFYNIFAR